LQGDGTTPTAGTTYNGKCTVCEVNDPIGNGQCELQDHGFANSGTRESCEQACKKVGATVRTYVASTSVVPPVTRFSLLENMVTERDGQITDGGFCGQVVYDALLRAWRFSGALHYICPNGWYGPDPQLNPLGAHPHTVYANDEIDSSNNVCATRACQHDIFSYLDDVRATANSGNTAHGAGPNRCLVTYKNDGEPCSALVSKTTQGVGTVTSLLAGKCNNGICLLEPDAECPVGQEAKTTKYILENCSSSPRGRRFYTTFFGNQANDATANFNAVPLADTTICTSHAHMDNGKWPTQTWDGVNPTETSPTGGTIQQNWGGPVPPILDGSQAEDPYIIHGPVDVAFNWMIFSQYYTWDNLTTTVEFSAEGTVQVKKGLGIICDPNMSDTDKLRYKCRISSTGLFEYAGANISVFENSNQTTQTYEISINPSAFTYYNVFICPGVTTNRCFGEFNCRYSVGAGLDYKKQYCGGEYTECVDATFDPTIDPTLDPTQDPTVLTTTSTAHGDPIIWTFYEECYDLNKDGLYDATVHDSFQHDVQIGVYNDFMRYIHLVDKEGNIMISINSLGEYYHDTQRWPHAFSYEEKDCPLDMKETECLDTYKEWNFDAQEFYYTVQLLRHDYKDNGIAEGDLGWHLDIYPKPYKSFYREGHMERYSGLFFENPLPEELEYCQGGSNRNLGIKQEQTLAKDAKKVIFR